MDIIKLAEYNRQAAWEILDDTRVIQAWESIGAMVNVVGSLKSGLLMKSRDIDLHVYTDRLDIAESFSVMRQLAERLPFKEIQYKNLIDTEEECIEWHALYENTDKNIWKFDIIHIRKGSKYDGVVEKVTDTIIKMLTPEIREAILRIKYEIPYDMMIPGIEIYRAVFQGNVRSYNEFEQWCKINPPEKNQGWVDLL